MKIKPTTPKRKPKTPPILKDKEAASKITADPKQILHFFENCIKKPVEKKI